ncbi:MAG TPA: 30S ribosomal protein S13 [Candidatus Nanoarchaeia archaeon]|nr:30S ribosomal protein S13 [Candidatus Nanoarchaeia archaeon]
MVQKTKQIEVEKVEPTHKGKEDKSETLVRILSTDIPGSKNLYSGFTYIKGVSFAISNALCHQLNLDRKRKIVSLSKPEIETISETLKNIKVPSYMMNRRNDFDTGKTAHLIATDLDLRKDFDIKRLKKIKSYKGIRHSRGLPVRGQRTKSHFRKKGRNKSVGVNKKK